MLTTPLTALEAASASMTVKVSLTSADVVLLTSGAAASIYPGFNETNTFPAGFYLVDAVAVVKTAFAGGAGTLTFGVADGTNQILAAGTDMTTAGVMAGYNLTKPVVYSAASKISITVTAGTAITGWTSGELDIYLNLVNLTALNR